MMDSEQLRLIRRMAKLEADKAEKATKGEFVSRMQLTAGGSAALSSAGHPLQVGETSGNNIIMDSRNIMARDNGSSATLYVNKNGGNVMMPRLRLTAKDNASLTSNGHALQVGSANDRNLRAGPYGIMSINNGAAAALHLNQYGGNVHVGYDASDGELLVYRNTVLHKGNVNIELVSSAGWTSGTLTVPGTAKYSAFEITTSGQGTLIIVYKYDNQYLRGGGMFVSATPTFRELYFSAAFAGDVWTFIACKYLDHLVSGAHSAATNLTVTSIRGLF